MRVCIVDCLKRHAQAMLTQEVLERVRAFKFSMLDQKRDQIDNLFDLPDSDGSGWVNVLAISLWTVFHLAVSPIFYFPLIMFCDLKEASWLLSYIKSGNFVSTT